MATYSNSVYSVWLASGKEAINYGKKRLIYNRLITRLTADKTGIETKERAGKGYLFEGPYYYQDRSHKIYGGSIIYNADFRLKIELTDLLPENCQNDTVCVMQVVASRFEETKDGYTVEYDTVLLERGVYINHFMDKANNTISWNEWQYISIGNYMLTPLNQMRKDYVGKKVFTGSKFSTDFMQYKIFWKGLPYIRLSVDTIRVYDCVGEEFIKNEIAEKTLRDMIDYSRGRDSLPQIVNIGVLSSIDNYLSYKKLIKILEDEIKPFVIHPNNLPETIDNRYFMRKYTTPKSKSIILKEQFEN